MYTYIEYAYWKKMKNVFFHYGLRLKGIKIKTKGQGFTSRFTYSETCRSQASSMNLHSGQAPGRTGFGCHG
jgi:hypothetical protein